MSLRICATLWSMAWRYGDGSQPASNAEDGGKSLAHRHAARRCARWTASRVSRRTHETRLPKQTHPALASGPTRSSRPCRRAPSWGANQNGWTFSWPTEEHSKPIAEQHARRQSASARPTPRPCDKAIGGCGSRREGGKLGAWRTIASGKGSEQSRGLPRKQKKGERRRPSSASMTIRQTIRGGERRVCARAKRAPSRRASSGPPYSADVDAQHHDGAFCADSPAGGAFARQRSFPLSLR